MADIYGNLSIKNTISSEGGAFKVFPGPGIIENNKLTKVELLETKDKTSKYLSLEFTNESGATLNRLEFPISADRIADEAKLKSKLENQLKRLKHIITKYYGEEGIPSVKTFETLISSITSFEDLGTKVCALLNTKIVKETPVRLKVVYSYNNYKVLPDYVPFIELCSVPLEETKLRIDPSFDKIVKDEVTADKSEDLASIPTAKETDDLPF